MDPGGPAHQPGSDATVILLVWRQRIERFAVRVPASLIERRQTAPPSLALCGQFGVAMAVEQAIRHFLIHVDGQPNRRGCPRRLAVSRVTF